MQCAHRLNRLNNLAVN